MELQRDDEEALIRSVAIQNAQTILLARQRAEDELRAANEALELRTKELERANELIRTIAENAASSLLMIDTRGFATYINPAAVEETGYTSEEFANAPVHALLHASVEQGGHAADACPIRNARERLMPLKNHHDVFVRKDGSTFPVSCSLSPLQRDGHAAGAVLEFRDVTDEELAQQALEDANRRKDQFLATLSHELRTPMTAVLGWARLLKLGLPEAEVVEAIDAIEKSAAIQAQLIDDVLDVSRVVAGKMTFLPLPVGIGPVLHAALATVHPAATAKEIEIVVKVAPDLPPILGDEGRLQQIIWNLLANAVKFTPRGGTITVSAAQEGSLLRVTVKDSGKGIEPAYLPHVFEPFSQQDGSSTRSHEGIGLGLSIVRALVELHGGRVRVFSDGPGRGAAFTVEFPILETAASIGGPAVPQVAREVPEVPGVLAALDDVRVLIIDDQEFTRDVVGAIFRRAGAEVRSASSVREGLQEFAATSPHVVVCDVAMPEEDGYVFVREVRALRTMVRKTPIVALTAFSRPEDRDYALAAGFDAYLKKPVDPLELALTVLRLSQRA